MWSQRLSLGSVVGAKELSQRWQDATRDYLSVGCSKEDIPKCPRTDPISSSDQTSLLCSSADSFSFGRVSGGILRSGQQRDLLQNGVNGVDQDEGR
jgi:hypothetical protein